MLECGGRGRGGGRGAEASRREPDKAHGVDGVSEAADATGMRSGVGATQSLAPRRGPTSTMTTSRPETDLGLDRYLKEAYTGLGGTGRGRTCKENKAKYSKNSFMSFPGSSEPLGACNKWVSLGMGLV